MADAGETPSKFIALKNGSYYIILALFDVLAPSLVDALLKYWAKGHKIKLA